LINDMSDSCSCMVKVSRFPDNANSLLKIIESLSDANDRPV